MQPFRSIYAERLKSIVPALAVVAVVFFGAFAGCENNSDVEDSADGAGPAAVGLSIDPVSVALDPDSGHTAFTISGGDPPFRWSVSDSSLGAVSPTSTVARTASYRPVAGQNGVNIVSVMDSGDSIVTATVVQGDEMEVSLSTASISTNVAHSVTATVQGGTSPYSWSVSDGSLGFISAASGNTATYRSHAGQAGANFIQAEDQFGWTAQAEITQQ
jgi:hypothetical protein